MKNSKRTIEALRDILKGKVYVYLKDRRTCLKFYEDAEAEGFMFGNIRPTDSPADNIIAVSKDRTLAHAGFTGHMAFMSPSAVKGGLTRIDYAKYIEGDEDFYYEEE